MKRLSFHEYWIFQKPGCAFEAVTLPHTWNAKDGTDGGNDYYRGTCVYEKSFAKPALQDGEELWIEFRGAAMTADVSLNGRKLAHHEGGYSTFRVNLTEALAEENVLSVSVDNGKNDRVYPQKADFTFYGGLYRDVYLLIVPQEHFELAYYGTPGIKVTPVLSDDLKTATVTVQTWHNAESVEITVNGEAKPVRDTAEFVIKKPRLWNGLHDPYLYTASAKLRSGDEVSAAFGIRKIGFDPEKGFLLNGRPYRLCGAARHQDREDLGSALTKKEHEEDIALLLEMGANTVRLAHYQQDQAVYDLCDESGLIVQSYNHPSIVCWGLSNEITTTAGVTEEIVENHRALNDLCHKLDKTRPTTMAHVFMLPPEDPFVMLPDIRSYNLYYGWYVGEKEQNDEWFDAFHEKHPDAVIGLSEYGADANPQYQSGPGKGRLDGELPGGVS